MLVIDRLWWNRSQQLEATDNLPTIGVSCFLIIVLTIVCFFHLIFTSVQMRLEKVASLPIFLYLFSVFYPLYFSFIIYIPIPIFFFIKRIRVVFINFVY